MITEKMHELYGKIRDMEHRLDILNYKITELEKEDSSVDASLTLVINGRVRGTSKHYLNKSQVLKVLTDETTDIILELSDLNDKYKSFQ